MALRVVFFGNSESVFSNRHFAALLDAPCFLAAVVDVPPGKRASTNTRPADDAPTFVELARARAIPTLDPASPNQTEFVQAIRALEPDLFIAVGYMNLLKEEVLTVPRLLAANFHASLLPAYRGKHPLFWALRNGERRVGLTVHLMSPGLDTGDILYQVKVRTRCDDSVAKLYDRIMERSVGLVARLLADTEAGTLHPRAQGEDGASYYSSVAADDFRLEWGRPAEVLVRWINASPGRCSCPVAGHTVHFFDAESVAAVNDYIPCTSPCSPGQIVKIGGKSCVVKTGHGMLRLRRASLEGGSEQFMAQVCCALQLKEGDFLLAAGK